MFKWGIVGTGLVSSAFVNGVKGCSSDAAVAAVYSKNNASSKKFASSFNIKKVASNFEELCSLNLDAVYIATPPKYHEKYAIGCIKSGLPVLIEKPFAYDSMAAMRICNAAKENNVFCMEGLWTRFLPLISEVKKFISNGDLGELKFFRGEFMNANITSTESSLFDLHKGGGALMYRGVYPLSLAQYFMGSIEKVSSIASIGSTGVDEDCSINIMHTNGAISNVRASLTVSGENNFEVHGTRGKICIKGPIMRPKFATISYYEPSKISRFNPKNKFDSLKSSDFVQKIKQFKDHNSLFGCISRGKKITKYYKGNGFTHEIDEFMQGVFNGKLESKIMPLDESIEIMKIIDDLRNSWSALDR